MKIEKKNIIIVILILIILFLVYTTILINKTKNDFENRLNNVEINLKKDSTNLENKIYFNLWLYTIKQKNEIGKFLKWTDFELGDQYNSDEKYKIGENSYTQLKDINIIFKYLDKNKTLEIYIRIWDSQTKKEIEHLDVSQEVLEQISSDIFSILAQSVFVPIGEQKIDITKDFIDYINFNFILSPERVESGEPIGQVVFERNKEKDRIFYFDFLK
ncbi:MAG: hypothetical protein Ta2D_08880 [Rickettsiales bacterium]|nr:MAG: hypothetical protein Ta2D_08880 [Rickettsiales bacterium]